MLDVITIQAIMKKGGGHKYYKILLYNSWTALNMYILLNSTILYLILFSPLVNLASTYTIAHGLCLSLY